MSDSWFEAARCSLDEFRSIVERPTDVDDYPHASRSEQGVVIYDAAALTSSKECLGEIAEVLSHGPGIVVLEGAVGAATIDAATVAFESIIDGERETKGEVGDHFATAGDNDRVWNALEKLAIADPDVFVDYYASDAIALASLAWLGPDYQMTSQVNVVNPGGKAQHPHRDYHLGFMEDDVAEQYPAHIHRLSPMLTLQGAVAHCDMPIETGPTMYLPHSQKYEPGYVAWRRDDFREYFAEHHCQLPLAKGDAVFFNPAVFHGAGTNQTADVRRMANLLQVSTAFGRAMEAIDRRAMVRAIYPSLLERLDAGVDRACLDRAILASAEGYSFPGDLDVDQPVDGLAPPSDAAIARRALDEQWTQQQLNEQLKERTS
jgi:ectoine hydroxylase-related dioxygenase (phytanoyl-CoA dioxygenase family)